MRGTWKIWLVGDHSFIVGTIFRRSCTRYIVYRKIICWLAYRWPFRSTSWSWIMMALVNCSLQVLKSRQVTALYSLIFGDIVDSEPAVSYCQIIFLQMKHIPCFQEVLTMFQKWSVNMYPDDSPQSFRGWFRSSGIFVSKHGNSC